MHIVAVAKLLAAVSGFGDIGDIYNLMLRDAQEYRISIWECDGQTSCVFGR